MQAEANDTGEATRRSRVFVSYSRQDLAFVEEVVGALELAGFTPTIDRHAIAEGEAWQTRLAALIVEADTVVFVLSPASAQSKVCAWELAKAQELSKRILPVLHRPLESHAAPAALAALNYVRFDEGGSFTAAAKRLVTALDADLGWLREHTRLLQRASEWDAAGRANNRLLIGSDIADAKTWLDARPKEAPAPTDLHHAFIQASDEAEVDRNSAERAVSRKLRLRLWAMVALMALSAIGLAVSAWAYRKSLDEAQRADRFYNLVSSDPAGQRAMQAICREAVDVTGRLATTAEPAAYEAASDRFWELYFGPMYIVELHQRKQSGADVSAIEAAMVGFGRALRAAQGVSPTRLPRRGLCADAEAVRDNCNAHLTGLAAPAPCT